MSTRLLLTALLVGGLAICVAFGFFAFGVFTAHYQTFPWPWLVSLVQESRAPVKQQVITSSLLNFDLVIPNAGSPIGGDGGGLAVTDEGVLIAHSLTGNLYFYNKATQEVYRIKLLLPDNHFTELPDKTPAGRKVRKNFLRYNDVEFIKRNGGLSLLVSYTYFYPDKGCFTNRLAIRSLENGWSKPATNGAGTRDGWQVVFETEPCVPFFDADPKGIVKNTLPGEDAGGRIAIASDGIVYLTVGDFEFDGLKEGPIYPQVPNSDYGKTIRIDPRDWSATKFSFGHRNPQGITIDDKGRIWLVEHGPMGGDELNLIRQGLNYGWPYVTLGVDYAEQSADDKSWPLSSSQGRHDKYESPAFAWLPSIGISNVKQLHGLHPRWDGDLLVSSLAGQSLHRIRLVDDRILYEERISLGARVRYVDIGKGEIYLLFDDGRFAILRPRLTETLVAEKAGITLSAPARQANALESAGCLECHSSPEAPRLSGVVGTHIAARPGVRYSAALRKTNDTWTEENLRIFLRNPQAFAPGTTMPNLFLSEAEIDKIVAQLAKSSGVR